MEKEKKKESSPTMKKINPVQKANFLSVFTYSYMLPIFYKSLKTEITENDLFAPLKEHKSSNLCDKLERIWKEEFRIHKKTALHRALIRTFWVPHLFYFIVKLLAEVIFITIAPIAIGKLVKYLEKDQITVTKEEAYIYASAMIFSLASVCLLVTPAIMGTQHISMKMRLACSSLLYRKMLRLSRTSLGKTTIGHLVNLLANDARKFDENFILAHYLIIGPLEIALGTYMLYREIGVASLFGVAFLLSFIPLQVWIGNRTSAVRLRTALSTDERVRLMSEIISGIQVIKMYCWEKPFSQIISFVRKKEMKAVRIHNYLYTLICSFEFFLARTSIFISIISYILLGHYITAEKVFAIITVYMVMKPIVTTIFSLSISGVAEANVTIHRFQHILSLEEREEEIPSSPISNGNLKDDSNSISRIDVTKPQVILKEVSAKWVKDAPSDTLNKINLNIHTNQLLAVIGTVGSGKTSLLNIILKELPVKSGFMNIDGVISFASQESWLFSGSVRENILFGEQYDEKRYEEVVEVCALQSDFSLLPFGDRSLVGEKGKSLSGGQKARINLARCIYKQADIYLLDDPLSAVDANVGKHLFERCIKKFLHNKICILVTHQLQYLKSVDRIIVLEDGQISLAGTFDELQSSNLDFSKLLEGVHDEHDEKQKSVKSRQNSEKESEIDDDGEDNPEEEREFQSTGKVQLKAYWEYIKSGGSKWSIAFLVFMFLLCQGLGNGGEYYVTYWVDLEEDLTEKITNNITTNETFNRNQIIYIYTAITGTTIIFAVIKSLYFMTYCTFASANLHDKIFSRIIKATMKFYNHNPSGRILNRFSRDLGTIDEHIPLIVSDLIECFLIVVGVVVLNTFVEPWLLIPSIIMCVCAYLIRYVYIHTSRSLKRVEAITRSPIYSHMSTSINGLSTIRAFKAEKVFAKKFDDLQDRHSSSWYLFLGASNCFTLWIDLLCVLFTAVCTFALLNANKDLYGGELGLVLTQCSSLLGLLQWGMRQWCEIENQMTSVERVLEYAKIEIESERKPTNLPQNWPQEGQIEFRNVNLRYNENEPYVLKNLNFTVKPKEKIGIVGRTGAGKSSTISVLFQLYDLEGQIYLDDIDSTQVPLEQVRSKISIIPQEPVLFSGTMRTNLDPFEEYNDDILWNALEQVELKGDIDELPCGLNSNVTEGGNNFSVGQRQLICLARALIRNNKILVLDEATANVDPYTDSLIQQTIRNKFADCTVLTIAHRLNTVMDSDKILVMNAGTMEEFDHPYVLLQNENGILHKLVESTGSNMSKKLESVAKEKYLKKII